MTYRPGARLRAPLVGFKMVKAEAIAISPSHERPHRASLSFGRAKSGGSAQRASPLSNMLLAAMMPEAVDDSEGRAHEWLSQCGQWAKAAIAVSAQSPTRRHRASRLSWPK
jgi:hypothetical protein